MSFDEFRLLVFAKAPVEGKVKTRLYTFDESDELSVSAQAAADIHRALVSHTLNRLCEDFLPQMELWGSAEHDWLCSQQQHFGLPLHIQQGTSLGQKMFNAAENVLQQAASVIIIGTDCPEMSSSYVDQARKALEKFPVVIGPASDGGYVLIGMRQVLPEVFENIQWGSSRVLQQTRDQLTANNLSWFELDTLSDLDRPRDLLRLKKIQPELYEQLIGLL